MSNIYITEPPTRGKVLLHTSFGDLDVELWADQAPLACRNFVQLCLEGYYDNTIFHRCVEWLVIGLVVQPSAAGLHACLTFVPSVRCMRVISSVGSKRYLRSVLLHPQPTRILSVSYTHLTLPTNREV